MKRIQMLATMLAIAAACAPGARAQEKPKTADEKLATDRSSIPAKVQIVLSEYEGEKKVSSLPYLMMVRIEARVGRNNQLRMGLRVPIEIKGKDSAVQYVDVGTNIDCQVWWEQEGRYKMNLSLERSSLYTAATDPRRGNLPAETIASQPVFQQFRTSMDLLFTQDGQTIQSTVASDPLTGRVLKLDVTLNLVK